MGHTLLCMMKFRGREVGVGSLSSPCVITWDNTAGGGHHLGYAQSNGGGRISRSRGSNRSQNGQGATCLLRGTTWQTGARRALARSLAYHLSCCRPLVRFWASSPIRSRTAPATCCSNAPAAPLMLRLQGAGGTGHRVNGEPIRPDLLHPRTSQPLTPARCQNPWAGSGYRTPGPGAGPPPSASWLPAQVPAAAASGL